ncbi:TonB-dependent receptor [Marivirga sp. S37H4]|uniref:TonB-dependent receptor n=1 Tax=Marivirga aurantiaca TaxID=2802615 RepID=A0A935C613_9BACT|nr:TonB-dependent receptor [Marivirga aurantiaca]MBK6264114.1 TonB-dependent receptor [Marivirga aurantiaca]
MKKLLLSIFLLFVLFEVQAQTGEIKGTIKDTETEEPLIGATVILENTRFGTTADLQGEFTLPNVPSGNYTLKVSYVGYGTYTSNIELSSTQTVLNLGVITMEQSTVGLKEVSVFASVVEDRKTPVAISTINAKEISERFSDLEITDIVQNTPGVYSIQGSGGFGDNEVYIRGLDQTNVAFLVNGIPVNDMENGRMYWSNFAGLSEVTRQTQVQRGLGASKLAINAIGGTVNMITKPAERKKGGQLSYQTGTGAWNQRTSFSYNTGQSNNGWALSFQGSRTTSNSGLIGLQNKNQGTVVPGAFVDAWSYYLAVSKKINKKHQIMFWGFGAPVNRGSAFVVDEATREEFGITDPNANGILGTYQGEIYNVRQNKINKPLMAMSHYWDIDKRTSVSTSLYFSFADVYSVQPRDAENSLFLPTRTKDMIGEELTSDNLVNWDYLAAQNRLPGDEVTIPFPNGDINTPEVTGFASKYFAEARYNNHNWIGLISNFNKRIDNLNLLAGIDLRHYNGSHFARVHETFGGDFVMNRSNFGDNYNRLKPNNIAYQGDKFNYDYEGEVNWAALFTQAEYTYDKFTAFLSLAGTNSYYTRYGKFWNDRPAFVDNSLGKSETLNFFTYTAKSGVSYTPTNRHRVYVNVGYFIRPPFFADVFADARYSNTVTNNFTLEKVASAEVGYGYLSSKLRANFNAYYTNWYDRNVPFNVTGGQGGDQLEGIDQGGFIPVNLGGIGSLYKGLEFDFTYNVLPSLEINGYASLGDWKYTSGSDVSVIAEGDTAIISVDLAGFPVGTVAQTTAGLGLHYTGIRSMYMGARMNYADRISVRFAPSDVAQGYIDAEQIQSGFGDYATVDIYMGRYINFSDELSGRLSFSVQNILDTEYIRWSSYFLNQFQNGYGYGRTYTIGLNVSF